MDENKITDLCLFVFCFFLKILTRNAVNSSSGVVRSLSSSEELDRRQSGHEIDVSTDVMALLMS
jgi:hypothetical protein